MPGITYYELGSAQQVLIECGFTKTYYYLAHLLDRILLGEYIQEKDNELSQALRNGEVLELHLFNAEKEVFIVRKGERYVKYQELVHNKDNQDAALTKTCDILPNILKNNKLDKNTKLEVKEYINHDEETHLAYVEKTILYGLIRGEA